MVIKMKKNEEYFLEQCKEYYYEKKDLDSALRILHEGINVFPFSENLYFCMSTVLNKKKEFKSAFKALNKAIELNSEFITAYFKRGMWNLDRKLFKESLQDFTYVINKKDLYYLEAAYFLRAICYMYLKKYQLSFLDYKMLSDRFQHLGPKYPTKNELYNKIILHIK